MPDEYGLVNKDQAIRLIGEMPAGKSKRATLLLVEGVERFFQDQPSQLRSPFDLVFFVEILKDRVDLALGTINGSAEPFGWGDEEDLTRTRAVVGSAADADGTGIRRGQASNYVASCCDRGLKGALLTFINGAYVRQRPGGRMLTGEAVVVMRPEFPFDYLFMVMALDHVLRDCSPFRRTLQADWSESESPSIQT
jgi:hypothetical protein